MQRFEIYMCVHIGLDCAARTAHKTEFPRRIFIADSEYRKRTTMIRNTATRRQTKALDCIEKLVARRIKSSLNPREHPLLRSPRV